MTRYPNNGAVAAVLVILGVQLGAQSLTDVAKAEEARRKSVKQPAKVYTNEDLKPAPEPPAAASSPAATDRPATPAVAAQSPPPPAIGEDGKNTEVYWKDRLGKARDALTHDRVLVEAIQSRINALTTDFVNTADPAQRAVVQTNRSTALAELDRLNKDIQTQTKLIADTQEEGRKAGVPAGWLR